MGFFLHRLLSGNDSRSLMISAVLPVFLALSGCATTGKNMLPPDSGTAPDAAVPDTAADLVATESDSAGVPEAETDTGEAAADSAAEDPGEFIENARRSCAEGDFAAADSSLKKAIQTIETASEERETEWFPASRYVSEIVSIYNDRMPPGYPVPDDIAESAFQQKMARSLDSIRIMPAESLFTATMACRKNQVYDVPMTWNDRVERALLYYVNNRRITIDRWFLRASYYVPFMRKTFADSGLPQDLAYLPLIESGFNPKAYSYAQASGIWQFITSTGRLYGLRHTYWLDERRDPLRSTQAAASYLKKLYGDFGHWHLALAAYNCGENGMNRAILKGQSFDFWKLSRLPAQTRNYVPSYLAALTIAKNAPCFGIAAAPADTFPRDTVLVDDCIALDDVARGLSIPADSLKMMNPHLLRWCTPPDVTGTILYLPSGHKAKFAEFRSGLPDERKVAWCRYEVKSSDNIGKIARQFRITVDGVKEINRLAGDRVTAGQHLFLPLPRGDEKMTAYYVPPELPKEDDFSYITRYRIRRGDCISTIARRFHVSCAQIYRWNRLTPKSKLRVGRRIIVRPGPPPEEPVVAAAARRSGSGGTYTVQLGDTPFSIARRHGIAITDLLAWNSIDATRPVIQIGKTLKLYDPAVKPPEAAAGRTVSDTSEARTGPEDFSIMWEDTPWTDDWASVLSADGNHDSLHAVPAVVRDSSSAAAPAASPDGR